MVEQNVKKISLAAEGIICSGCAMDMEKVMRDMDGLLDVSVSYSKGSIAVTYDPAELTEEDIIATVKRFGLKTRIIAR